MMPQMLANNHGVLCQYSVLICSEERLQTEGSMLQRCS
jgi:hypothetical protein